MERRKVIHNKNGGKFRRFVFGGMTPHEAYRYLINFIYPNVCPCCDEIIDHYEDFCDNCHKEINRDTEIINIKHADEFIAYCVYEKSVKSAILKLKIDARGNSYYAFACGIVKALREKGLDETIDMVTYIPMTKEDEKARGYNLVKLIAKEIHYLLEIPCVNALIKVKKTEKQKALTSDKRVLNVFGAFEPNFKVDLKGKCVLVVDDLCTTGSTLSEAARALKNGGARKIIAASFAKTKKDKLNKRLD